MSTSNKQPFQWFNQPSLQIVVFFWFIWLVGSAIGILKETTSFTTLPSLYFSVMMIASVVPVIQITRNYRSKGNQASGTSHPQPE